MITKAPSFVTSDQQTFLTLEAAQGHELSQLWLSADTQAKNGEAVPAWIWNHREKIVDILTTTPSSKTRARKVNGGTKKRKAAAVAPQLPMPGPHENQPGPHP